MSPPASISHRRAPRPQRAGRAEKGGKGKSWEAKRNLLELQSSVTRGAHSALRAGSRWGGWFLELPLTLWVFPGGNRGVAGRTKMDGAHGEPGAAFRGTSPSHKPACQELDTHTALGRVSRTGSVHRPSPSSCPLPKSSTGRSGTAPPARHSPPGSAQPEGGLEIEGCCNKHHCRLAELGIIVAKPLRTC